MGKKEGLIQRGGGGLETVTETHILLDTYSKKTVFIHICFSKKQYACICGFFNKSSKET